MSEDKSPISESKPRPARKRPTESPKPEARAIVESPTGLAVTGRTDPVYDALIVADPNRKKSLTIHHLQRRLTEVGYAEAAAGLDGQYDALTQRAFEAWQSDNGFEPGAATFDQLERLFEGDSNVEVRRG